MRFEVYEEETKTEKVTHLKLSSTASGNIILTVVDEAGKRKAGDYILLIKKKGISLYGSVNKDIGLELDDDGKVKLI